MCVVCGCGTVEQVILEMAGPSRSDQWLYWKSQTVEQRNRVATIRELEKLLQSDVVCVLCIVTAVKSRLLAALVDKPQAQIMCQKPGKTLILIDKPQVYFVDVVKCVNKVCSQR